MGVVMFETLPPTIVAAYARPPRPPGFPSPGHHAEAWLLPPPGRGLGSAERQESRAGRLVHLSLRRGVWAGPGAPRVLQGARSRCF